MSEGSQKTLSWEKSESAGFPSWVLLAPALFPEGKRRPTSWGNHLSQVVQSSSAGPASGNLHDEDTVAIVEVRRKTSLSSGAVTALRTAQIECISGTSCGSPGRVLDARLQQLGKPHHPKIYPPDGRRRAASFPSLA